MADPDCIQLRGARQNNLKGFDLDLPLGKMTVVTGLSGSGKSSLVFDTLYAEGQRRYVETFSPYARQFLERLDPPRVDSIEGIPPAIAIQQGNSVKTSRSTVGTLTELCDYFKLLMPHQAKLVCPGCGQEVREDSLETILHHFDALPRDTRVLVCFRVAVASAKVVPSLIATLRQQGYRRFWSRGAIQELDRALHASRLTDHKGGGLLVIQDRLALSDRARLAEAVETAFRAGQGRLAIITPGDGQEHRFSKGRHCARCDRSFPEPSPSLFSFNNPLGACPACRGFGRTMEIDHGRVIPDPALSLRQGVVKPWQSGVSAECQEDLLKWCRRRGVDPDLPFKRLPERHRRWVIEGDPEDPGDTGYGPWYGVKGYFRWLESKSYKMHMRVLISRYRVYRTCAACGGGRFQPETLNHLFAGQSLAALYALPIRDLRELVGGRLHAPGHTASPTDPAGLVLREIHARLALLGEVGLDYLTLDRPARTLSGGEVQRVNLIACLGAAMVNTLFILDEPSVGLHPRDVERLVRVLHALRDRGNTLVVVEHEPAVIRAGDHLVDLGPGAGEAGGEVVWEGRLGSTLDAQRPTTNEQKPFGGLRAVPEGLAAEISHSPSLTLDYLSGRRSVPLPSRRRPVDKSTPRLTIRGAAENNLRQITVDLPLGRFVCVTGVSGSGKSTLIHRVLFENLQALRGEARGEPGRCEGLEGHEHLAGWVLVDQSPLARTSRSNPAVYLGAWDAIREGFAAIDESRRRGLSAGSFSFNAGEGRCERCGGNGHEKVEMQFLPDVFVQCPVCRGRRFRRETLEVKLDGKSVADLLESTVTEAIAHLGDAREGERWRGAAVARLRLLKRVGLGYLRLGQPVNTLSGGEAQRLKLCGFLAESLGGAVGASKSAGRRTSDVERGSLLIFDEPTTGLHFEDVRQLVAVFQELVERGHSILVIEHNLEMVKCADWIVDLGPEAGDRGGGVLACGAPEKIAAHPKSHTGRFLRNLLDARCSTPDVPSGIQTQIYENSDRAVRAHEIKMTGAREHNLKNISLAIPRDQFVVLTGLSGSGKSTLAFDLVFAEGQRRFLDCMSTYARQYVEQMPRPDMDRVEGIPPTVAIEQRVTRGGWKSTVATITEAYHFIRLLFAKVGLQHCPRCERPIREQTEDEAVAQVLALARRRPLRLLAPAVRGRKGFHDEVIQWAHRHGIMRLRVDGVLREVSSLLDGKKLARYVEHTLEFDTGVLKKGSKDRTLVREALRLGRGTVLAADDDRSSETVISLARACPSCGQSFAPLDPRDFSFNSPSGWCPECFGYGVLWDGEKLDELEGEEEAARDVRIERRAPGRDEGEGRPCPACEGARLKLNSRHVRVGGRTLTDLNAMSAAGAMSWFRDLRFRGREGRLARDILPQIIERLRFMGEVGLDYLGLGRAAVTLSGGEAQRIRLAAQLGSNLRGVLYVLDEPTIGLHPRDNEKLLGILERLKRRGNSLLVVEHDEETMRRADWLIDLGPGAGRNGGEVVWQGKPGSTFAARRSKERRPLEKSTGSEIACSSSRGALATHVGVLPSHSSSRTLDFLNNPMRHPMRGERRELRTAEWLTVRKATLHNLRGVTARFPVARFTVVTGVSGAGKSSLVRGVLFQGLHRPKSPFGRMIAGREAVAAAYEVDQSPIGKTPRSCPATYLGVWDEIRRLYATTPDARLRGHTASRFSFNVGGGRCERCEGQGRVKLEMNFLPDTHVRCELCRGARFNTETLQILHRGRNIAQALEMSVEEAAEFYSFDRKIAEPLRLMAETGLGYLTLGQSSPTLSGGEAQRLKLVSELMRGRGPASRPAGPGRTVPGNVYVLEEPTIGLHFADVEKLIGVLHQLVDAGHTVIVIEHNPDLVAEADYVLDLGPEGGEGGGRVVAAGSPEEVARHKLSRTAPFLRRVLRRG